MKKILAFFCAVLAFAGARAQTTIWQETFESGNSLTLVNAAYYGWTRTTTSTYVNAGSYGLGAANYTTNNGTWFRSHAYRNVTFPSPTGTPFTLSFHWKIARTANFSLRVYVCETSYTPVAGTAPSGTLIAQFTAPVNEWVQANLALPESYAGTTKRIVFYADAYGSPAFTAPAYTIDNIVLQYNTAPITKTVNVTTPGGLCGMLTVNEKSFTSELTVTGTIDARDLRCIRDNMPSLTKLDLSGANIAAYTGTDGTVMGTSTVYAADLLPQYSFYNNQGAISKTRITSVKLPASVTSIGNYAFYGCTGLTSVTLPSSLTTLGSYAFSGCTNLGETTLPQSLLSIGVGAFQSCTKLETTLPPNLTTIATYAFYNCDELTDVTIPGGVATIGQQAFYDCAKLANLTISSGVVTIDDYAFYNCRELTAVAVPGGVTTIGDYAFASCTKLASLTLPASLITIYTYAFQGCTTLAVVTIPASVTSVGQNAFNGCSNLSTIISLRTPTPPTAGTTSFAGIKAGACLRVFPEAMENYRFAAGWEAITCKVEGVVAHTVTFNAQGGTPTPSSQAIAENAYATQPASPTLTGYTFGGWYRESSGVNLWNFNTEIVEGDMTLFAKWTATEYLVDFDAQGGAPAPSSQTIAFGQKVAQPAADPVRDGYVFAGWYKEAACTNEWSFDTDVVHASNTTLYAKWSHVVTFNSLGGTGVAEQLVKEGGFAEQPVIPTRVGYTFAGWYADACCTTPWNFASNAVNGDVMIYAKWQE